MILILAASRDDATDAFTAELTPTPAALLTYADLACEPSCLCDPAFGDSTLTLAGQRAPVGEISGVVNLLPAVLPDALAMYDPAEREYQAAEMHAWLAFFLSQLQCPVVNRPTPLSLAGPAPSPLGWLALAADAGIPLAEVEVDSDDVDGRAREETPIDVVAVNSAIVKRSGTIADLHTATLAQRAELGYLKASYVYAHAECPCSHTSADDREVRFAGATSVPDLHDASVRQALAELLTR